MGTSVSIAVARPLLTASSSSLGLSNQIVLALGTNRFARSAFCGLFWPVIVNFSLLRSARLCTFASRRTNIATPLSI